MIGKLRRKFVGITMALTMTMLIVILAVVYNTTAAGLRNDSLDALKTAAAGQLRPGRPGEAPLPCFTLEKTPMGGLLAVGSDHYDLSDTRELAEIYAKALEKEQRTGVLREYSLRYYREETPLGTKIAFTDISLERGATDRLLQICILIGVVGFLGFLGISILLARWAVAPVERSWQQQRQFVADASHELKTPLTVILTNAELLQSEAYSEPEKQRFAQSILTMSRQMRGLVESLLQLARADNGQAKLEMTGVDWSELTEEAVLPFEPVYFERGLGLETEIQPDIFVNGNAAALRQVAEILLDNGQKYAAPGGTARLTLSRQGRKALLRFETPGSPLTPEQCRDVFKRFYRADAVRTMSGSYGLGLSIAQRVVEEHGGKIWAQGLPEGNAFYVNLPAAQGKNE